MAADWIFVVEDDKDTRELLREILESEGYRVTLAPSGEAALARLGGADEIPRLLVLDLVMPGMDGWQVVRAVRRQPAFERMPVLAVSATVPKQSMPEFASFLRKPFRLAELLEAVGRICRGRSTIGAGRPPAGTETRPEPVEAAGGVTPAVSAANRREFTRRMVRYPVQVQGTSGEPRQAAITHDVSPSGALVLSSDRFEVGQTIRVSFATPTAQQIFESEVVRIEESSPSERWPHAAAVQFKQPIDHFWNAIGLGALED